MADRISLRVFRPRLDGQVDLLPVGDGVAVMQVGLDFDLVFAAMFVRNAKNERIAFATRTGGRDCECVVAGPVAFQQERHAAAGGWERDCLEAAGLVAADRLDGHICRFFTTDCECIGEQSFRQLIVIDWLGVDSFLILTRQHAGLCRTVLHDRVGHLHAHVALVADRNCEVHRALLDRCGHEDGIARAIFGRFHLYRTAVRAYGRSVEAGACDLRVLGASAGQAELIQKLTVIDLVVLDGQRRTLVCIAENLLRCDGFLVPCELQLEV